MKLIERPPLITGRIELFTFDRHGRIIETYEAPNTVQYEGFDVLALIMAGRLAASVNAIYFQFENTSSGVLQDVSGRDVVASDFRALSGGRDFVRSQLAPGAMSASGVSYGSNQATFAGIAALGDLGDAQGLNFAAGVEVERCALAIAPNWADSSQDMVYAAWAPTTLIVAPSSGGVGLRWTIIFAHQWT